MTTAIIIIATCEIIRILQTESVKKPFQFRLAEKYGIVQYTPHSIEFYFEKCERGDNNDGI